MRTLRCPNSSRALKAKITIRGVDVYDRDGSWILGLTEQDAVDLHASLGLLMPRVKRLLKKWKQEDRK